MRSTRPTSQRARKLDAAKPISVMATMVITKPMPGTENWNRLSTLMKTA